MEQSVHDILKGLNSLGSSLNEMEPAILRRVLLALTNIKIDLENMNLEVDVYLPSWMINRSSDVKTPMCPVDHLLESKSERAHIEKPLILASFGCFFEWKRVGKGAESCYHCSRKAAEPKEPMENEDTPALQLRTINVLSVAPGRADVPITGEPIAILTYEHDSEIEQPLMVKMRDVRYLAKSFIEVLRHHQERDDELFSEADTVLQAEPIEERQNRRHQIRLPPELLAEWVRDRPCESCLRDHVIEAICLRDVNLVGRQWLLVIELICAFCKHREMTSAKLWKSKGLGK